MKSGLYLVDEYPGFHGSRYERPSGGARRSFALDDIKAHPHRRLSFLASQRGGPGMQQNGRCVFCAKDHPVAIYASDLNAHRLIETPHPHVRYPILHNARREDGSNLFARQASLLCWRGVCP